jgi:hypothetical protein
VNASLKIALLALPLLSTLPSSAARAQGGGPVARPVSVGSRVRILAPSIRRDRYVGRIDSLDVNEIVLDTAGVRRRLGFETGPVLVESYRLVSLRTSAIEKIELSAGRTVRRATIKGMVVGALGGALLFGFGNLPEVNPKAKDFFKGAPLGLALGAVGGAIVGYALGGERWVPAQLPR